MNTRMRSFLPAAITGIVVAIVIIVWRTQAQHQSIVMIESRAPTITTASPKSYADAVERAQPAVVNIYTSKIVTRNPQSLYDDPAFRRFFGLHDAPRRERMESSLGSGVIISTNGYVITNHHVVADADEIRVSLADGRETIASVIGTDPDTDLAVLFIDVPSLPSITLEQGNEPRVGDVVLAIGNPFGVGQTVTQGIVSALGRTQTGLSNFVDFIQTDAAINPGNSGGALINTDGHLVGINTAIFSKTGASNGIGFAIPVDLAKNIMTALVKDGAVVRGWLGIEPQMMTEGIARALHMDYSQGLLVAAVLTSGPAYAAGVRPGDIIVKIDALEAHDPREAMNYITRSRPGAIVELQVLRDGQPHTLKAIVGTRPNPN